jgi:hypothetical protein
MAKPPEKRFSWPLPNAEQRTFVCAAAAVGLTVDQICHMFPQAKEGLKRMTPERLKGFFPEEIKTGSKLAEQLVALRVLQDALGGKDREARAERLAVFKTLPDWRQFRATAEATQPIAVERLTDKERATLRRLLDKADPLKRGRDPSEDAEEEEEDEWPPPADQRRERAR